VPSRPRRCLTVAKRRTIVPDRRPRPLSAGIAGYLVQSTPHSGQRQEAFQLPHRPAAVGRPDPPAGGWGSLFSRSHLMNVGRFFGTGASERTGLYLP
jgi:hypothetical protein